VHEAIASKVHRYVRRLLAFLGKEHQITALETIGGSLLICTEDSISRFTGYSADDIQIAQDTRGISNEIGVVGPQAILNCENIAYSK